MRISTHISLAPYTTLHVGGPAEFFVEIHSAEELVDAVTWAKKYGHPMSILGGGSNVLVSDDGVKGLVVKNEIGGISYREEGTDVLVTAGAGIVWDVLVADFVFRGLWGLENLSAIPGRVGATPIQNVGAYGVEVSDRIVSVRAFDTDADLYTDLSADMCDFAYRDSLFKRDGGARYIITAVTYRLSHTPQPKLDYKDLREYFGTRSSTQDEIRQAVIAVRKKKFPDWNSIGTAGSFFKNPVVPALKFKELKDRYPDLPGFETTEGVKVPLGYVLDRILGLRGVRNGNVGTYEGQALVLVNYGGAQAHEVDAFATDIEQKVFKETGIVIEREVCPFPKK